MSVIHIEESGLKNTSDLHEETETESGSEDISEIETQAIEDFGEGTSDGDGWDYETIEDADYPSVSEVIDASADPKLLKKKKKKKKKKYKKKSQPPSKEVADSNPISMPEELMLPVEVADKRYACTLESLRKDDALLWMQLNRCRITDKRARKLFAALKDDKNLTSMDLSENALTDDSMQSLMNVLQVGSAPNLIYIDVRNNPISNKSFDLLNRLQNLRKQLKVDFDGAQVEVWPDRAEEGVLQGDEEWMEGYPRNKWMADCTENGVNWQADNPITGKNLWISSPQSLREKVDFFLEAVKSSENMSIAVLAMTLREITVILQQLLFHNNQTRANEWTTLHQLPEGLQVLLERFEEFLSVFEINSPPVLCQRKLEEKSAGLHRIALVELLYLLLASGCTCIERELLVKDIPAKLVIIFFMFPWNNILHGGLFRCLQAALGRPSLCCSLFEGPTGLDSLLAKAGQECASLPMGKRPGHAGYIAKLSKEVEALRVKDSVLQDVLVHNELWTAYVGPEGSLQKMVAEQSGDLGGPKPAYTPFSAFYGNYSGRASTTDQIRGLVNQCAQSEMSFHFQEEVISI